MGQVAKLKGTWNIALVLQIVQKITKNYCSCFYLSVGQVWWLHELWFKRYIQKCTLPRVLILIVTSQILWVMGWLKTWISWERNIIFLNLCLSWHILRSYRFLAEVTFKTKFGNVYNLSINYLNLMIQKQLFTSVL